VAERIESIAVAALGDQFTPSLRAVINATGVIVHTNLGRAPLGNRALARVVAVAGGYSTLEYDLAGGTRGRRDVHAEGAICRLTGAEAAVVVNNNAAAALLILAALAAAREVIVSRGELVEIGGGFRIPDVMKQSGATLREVGTTNRTRASDYAAAIGDRTALILRVHPSNFRIEGFTARPSLPELVDLGRRFHVPVAEDLGSGFLRLANADDGAPTRAVALDEPAVEDSVAAGVDICCFSGDKLFGGPQSGIVLGRRELVERIRRHPLMRALRVDKMTYAALEATLLEYEAGRSAETVPVRRMLAVTSEAIRRRAEQIVESLAPVSGWRIALGPSTSAVGGGSAPGVELPTWVVTLERDDGGADRIAAMLRQLTPPLVARIENDRVLLDLRTVPPEQDAILLEHLRHVTSTAK
jgi:L-seryl-tRNA(Ser) seleniumtransferase